MTSLQTRSVGTKFPDEFDNWFLGKKGKQVTCVPLYALGPYHEASSDDHKKIVPPALHMGGVGFLRYGFKDKFADSQNLARCSFPRHWWTYTELLLTTSS